MSVLLVARGRTTLDHIAMLLKNSGIDAVSTTSDDEAIKQLEAGRVDALVIGGGVGEFPAQHLRSVAERNGAQVIRGALRGKNTEDYVRNELLQALRSPAE
jgi:ABC-type amino acid transport substrate-binding protein